MDRDRNRDRAWPVKPTGTDVSHAARHRPAEPFAIVSVVPCPGSRYGVSERIKATLLSMQAGRDEFLLPPDARPGSPGARGIRGHDTPPPQAGESGRKVGAEDVNPTKEQYPCRRLTWLN